MISVIPRLNLFSAHPGDVGGLTICFIRCDGGVCLASVKGRYGLIAMYMLQTLSSLLQCGKTIFFYSKKRQAGDFAGLSFIIQPTVAICACQ